MGNKLLVLMMSMVAAQCACAMTVSLETDSKEVPVFGAFTGTLVVANDTGSLVRLMAPSMLLGTLRYEVKSQTGIAVVAVADCSYTEEESAMELAGRERLLVPVYVMKANGVFLFGQEGPAQVRAILTVQHEHGEEPHEIPSSWQDIRVVPDARSEQWREYFEYVLDLNMPFTSPSMDKEFSRFAGSRYYAPHMLYQEFSYFALQGPGNAQRVAGFLGGLGPLMAANKAADRMWAAFSDGRFCFDSAHFRNDYYFLGR